MGLRAERTKSRPEARRGQKVAQKLGGDKKSPGKLGSTGEPKLEREGNWEEGFKGDADCVGGGEGGRERWPLGAAAL